MNASPGDTFAEQIKQLRSQLGLTQVSLAERLGVSFPTVNRWENGRSAPSQLSWNRLREIAGDSVLTRTDPPTTALVSTALDFTTHAAVVRTIVEGERLSFGHLENPAFATEISNIDPLPHQRIAVYDHMLKQPRLRYLLADDAGAGKTIMTGLYVREMISRRLLRRVLIVPPAGLVGNWQSELQTLFNLPFSIVSGASAKSSNPFIGADSDRVIISVDTLSGDRIFARLRDKDVEPYDLVVFDEAHKLSIDRTNDMRLRRTDRYRLAESLAGVGGLEPGWRLSWNAHHLLLLTATPHQGKDYPYYGLWRLLEPEIFSTPDAFEQFPSDRRADHFIRRTKEEMVYLSGEPLYPARISDTLGYDLSQGPISEQKLYDETTEYMRYVYNRAKLLNRSAAQLAMSVLQRRLASSTYALLRSFERRIEKLDDLIQRVQSGSLTEQELVVLQRRLAEEDDVFESKTADEESADAGREESEAAEDKLLAGVWATTVADLITEREQVIGLRDLARNVYDKGEESKFDKLREILTDPRFTGEKFIIFTEHKDTLEYLVKRLSGMGYSEQIAQIHGGLYYTERQKQVERFRLPHEQGGARFMVCTDAAAEGINLQFCWLMINFDVPWNPARLEQRMGRIHRYGQKHDPVRIMNLVAPSTREGLVIETLLNKLEVIRKSLGSEKVFDSIGRLFEGVSIKNYMERAVIEGAATIAQELEGRLTKEQVEALETKERMLYGDGGDVKSQLHRLREDLEQETYRRLLPGYVRQYVQAAAPLVDVDIEGSIDECFRFGPLKKGSTDPLLGALDRYTERQRDCLSIIRPDSKDSAIWVHPGEPVFECFRSVVSERLRAAALRGAVFVDPTAERPYLFHLALINVIREADPELASFALDETLECRLVGIKQADGVEIEVCPVEQLLLLKGSVGLAPAAQRLAANAERLKQQAAAFLLERVARDIAVEKRNVLIATMPDREQFVRRGFDFHESELAAARVLQSEKARAGSAAAAKALADIKEQQRSLAARRERAIATIQREPDLINAGSVVFIAHALIVPSQNEEDLARHDAEVERIAMEVARAYEEAAGARVIDVHTPELARAAGLGDNPGFDLLAIYPTNDPRGRRAIEVKGRARSGDVEVSANEWARAANLRHEYWLHVVYDCASPAPRLERVQDPFHGLLAKAKGSFLISPKEIRGASEDEAI